MKTGKTLMQLAAEIERQQSVKEDFKVDSRAMALNTWDHDQPTLEFADQSFGVTDLCHRQIGERMQIPARYYDRMRAEAPQLLSMNVNHWFKSTTETRLVRTLDGNARALLSDRYQIIDNFRVAQEILPVLQGFDGLHVESCEITERRMYIKCVNQRLQADVKKDDAVQAGVMITNSEVGSGAFAVTPLLFRLWCLNGCVVNDLKYRRNHVGRQTSTDDAVYAILSDEAKQADDQAIMLKARDTVKAALSEALFGQMVNQMREATEGAEVKAPVKAVERLAKSVGLTTEEGEGVLQQLIKGGDLTRYGMLNAVTRHAQDVESYDRSTELEEIGGRILSLNRNEWEAIAIAA